MQQTDYKNQSAASIDRNKLLTDLTSSMSVASGRIFSADESISRAKQMFDAYDSARRFYTEENA